MTVSSHTSKKGITGGYNTGSVAINDTDACQSEVVTITLANGDVLTATEGTVATSTDVTAMTFVASTGSSGSKRTAAAASLAGALNANSKLTATSDSFTVTITEVFGGAGGSIATGAGMSEVDWSGGVAFTVGHDKHTVAAGGTVGGFNSKGNIKSNVDLAKGREVYGSKLFLSTGTADKPGVKLARTGGTLAYNPQGRSVSLSTSAKQGADDGSDNFGWLIRGGAGTLLSGIASTNNILGIAGSDNTSRFAGSVHEFRSYRRKGLWSDTILDLFTGKVYAADGAAKNTIIGRLADGSDSEVQLSGIDESTYDHQPTRAIPGELVILFNFASFTTNSVDYSALNG